MGDLSPIMAAYLEAKEITGLGIGSGLFVREIYGICSVGRFTSEGEVQLSTGTTWAEALEGLRRG